MEGVRGFPHLTFPSFLSVFRFVHGVLPVALGRRVFRGRETRREGRSGFPGSCPPPAGEPRLLAWSVGFPRRYNPTGTEPVSSVTGDEWTHVVSCTSSLRPNYSPRAGLGVSVPQADGTWRSKE